MNLRHTVIFLKVSYFYKQIRSASLNGEQSLVTALCSRHASMWLELLFYPLKQGKLFKRAVVVYERPRSVGNMAAEVYATWRHSSK